MIPQRNISLISNTLMTAGGRRIPEAVIERDYVLAWFLTGLAGHPLRDVLAFKGGTALRRCWFEEYRFSEDLDFTLTRPITFEEILAGLDEIFATVEADSGLRIAFDREDRHGHQNSRTFYLRKANRLHGFWPPAPSDPDPHRVQALRHPLSVHTLCLKIKDPAKTRTARLCLCNIPGNRQRRSAPATGSK